jgi:hypothetical protein
MRVSKIVITEDWSLGDIGIDVVDPILKPVVETPSDFTRSIMAVHNQRTYLLLESKTQSPQVILQMLPSLPSLLRFFLQLVEWENSSWGRSLFSA